MEETFIREEMILGRLAMQRLARSHVIVFGIGGVGSYAAEGLARAGVGALTLVDSDTVGVSNLNRQLCALHSTLGRFKSDVMAERILDINPDCRVKSVPEHYCEETKERFFSQSCDYIVDAIDLVSCKLSLIQTAQERSIPIISSMGTGNKLDPMRFCITEESFAIAVFIIKRCSTARSFRKHRSSYRHRLPADGAFRHRCRGCRRARV